MKKILAVILSVLVIFSAISIFAGAEEKLNYVVIGDSIARGAGVYNSDASCYGRIVADTNGYNYKNFGVDGLTSTRLLVRLSFDEVKAAVEAADVISISIGGNDYLQQNVPLLVADVVIGNYGPLDEIEEKFRSNFAAIIARIKELNPDVVIIAQTLYNPRTDLVKRSFGEAVKRVNEVVCDYYDNNPGAIELIDTRSTIEGHPECVALDGIHPSAYGNIQLSRVVLQKLYDLGLGENLEPVVNTYGIDQIPYSSKILSELRKFFERFIKLIKSL